MAVGNIVDNLEGPRAFSARLRAVRWPVGFKISGVEQYDSQANPEQWLTSYAIVVRVARERCADMRIFQYG